MQRPAPQPGALLFGAPRPERPSAPANPAGRSALSGFGRYEAKSEQQDAACTTQIPERSWPSAGGCGSRAAAAPSNCGAAAQGSRNKARQVSARRHKSQQVTTSTDHGAGPRDGGATPADARPPPPPPQVFPSRAALRRADSRNKSRQLTTRRRELGRLLDERDGPTPLLRLRRRAIRRDEAR